MQIISNAGHSRPLSKNYFMANGKQHLIFGIFHDLETAVCFVFSQVNVSLDFSTIYIYIYIYIYI